MFAKDAELATEVNTILDALKTEGVVAELHEKWFGVAPTRVVHRHRPADADAQLIRQPGPGPSRTRRDAHGYLRHLPERRGDAAHLPMLLQGLWITLQLGPPASWRGWFWALALPWRGCTGPLPSGS
ncbi:hypothetical protein FLP41_05850 [Paracoccus marcusii]|uniref:hypothetical protein n=1 Tax=Paracoccus marcusii TaxID=59779 RepID=UPI002ED249CF|nr:hypothetical protein FLP41_05850 [Paracoccus marcusii]